MEGQVLRAYIVSKYGTMSEPLVKKIEEVLLPQLIASLWKEVLGQSDPNYLTVDEIAEIRKALSR